MCLISLLREVKKFKPANSDNEIYVYKVITTRLCSPVFKANWLPDTFMTVYNAKYHTSGAYMDINEGIHCYRTFRAAKKSHYVGIVIKVKADSLDLLGCNVTEAVFRRVFWDGSYYCPKTGKLKKLKLEIKW